MPRFPVPGRPGGEPGEPLLDMIFDRRPLPPEAPLEMHDLAGLVAALGGPAEPGELAGEAAALAAFRQIGSPAGAPPRCQARAPWTAGPAGRGAGRDGSCPRRRHGGGLRRACCPVRSSDWRTRRSARRRRIIPARAVRQCPGPCAQDVAYTSAQRASQAPARAAREAA